MKSSFGRQARSSTFVLLTTPLLAFTACSGGKASTRILDGAVAPYDAMPGSPIDGVAPGAMDTAQQDTAAKDGAIDLRANDAAAKDGGADTSTPSLPPYQEGPPFPRIAFDFLGKGYGESVCAVLPLPNNQVIIVGTTNTQIVTSPSTWTENEFTLIRLNSDGKPDTAFGTGGSTHVAFPKYTLNACKAAALTKDGKIVVAGDALGPGSKNDFVVARFTQDGVLDASFGDGGMTTTNFHLTPDDAGQDDKLESLALLDDGRILVGGGMTYVQGPTYGRAAFARYTADGAPDPTFGTGGMVLLELTAPSTSRPVSQQSTAAAILVDADGGTLAGISYVSSTGAYAIALLRLAPDGALDTGFADAGIRWEAPGRMGEVVHVSRSADGKPVLLAGTGQTIFLYRYLKSGAVDETFGVGGQATTSTKTPGAWQPVLLLQPSDGSYLVGLGAGPSASIGVFGLARYSPSGVYDEAFGLQTWSWDTFVPHLTAGAIMANGDLLLAGDITTQKTWNQDTIVLHLTKNTGP